MLGRRHSDLHDYLLFAEPAKVVVESGGRESITVNDTSLGLEATDPGVPPTNRHVLVLEVFSHEQQDAMIRLCRKYVGAWVGAKYTAPLRLCRPYSKHAA